MVMIMKKYEAMNARNRRLCEEKYQIALSAIHQMVDDNRKISISALVSETGLSRAYFYKNSRIASELRNAMSRQKGIPEIRYKRNSVLNHAMEKQIEILEQEIKELRQIIDKLEKENEILIKKKKKRELELLKRM